MVKGAAKEETSVNIEQGNQYVAGIIIKASCLQKTLQNMREYRIQKKFNS